MISKFEVEEILVPYSCLLQNFIPLLISDKDDIWFIEDIDGRIYLKTYDGIELPRNICYFNKNDCQIKCDELNNQI